jgi:hypothetical protein
VLDLREADAPARNHGAEVRDGWVVAREGDRHAEGLELVVQRLFVAQRELRERHDQIRAVQRVGPTGPGGGGGAGHELRQGLGGLGQHDRHPKRAAAIGEIEHVDVVHPGVPHGDFAVGSHERDVTLGAVRQLEGPRRGPVGIEPVGPASLEVDRVDQKRDRGRVDGRLDDLADAAAGSVVDPRVDRGCGRGAGEVEPGDGCVEVSTHPLQEVRRGGDARPVPQTVGDGELDRGVEAAQQVDHAAVRRVDRLQRQAAQLQCLPHRPLGLSGGAVVRHAEGHAHRQWRDEEVGTGLARGHGLEEFEREAVVRGDQVGLGGGEGSGELGDGADGVATTAGQQRRGDEDGHGRAADHRELSRAGGMG